MFDSTVDRFFTQPFSHVWPFFPFSKYAETPTLYFIGFSANNNIFVTKKLGLFVNTTALTDFFCFFCILFWVIFAVSGLGGLFVWKEWKTKNIEHETTKKETRPQDANQKNHLVLFTKQDNTDTKQCNFIVQTRNRQHTKKKKNKNTIIKHKTNYLLTNLKFKKNALQGEQCFFIDWKENKKQDKHIWKEKLENDQKQNQHRNKKAETYTMKTKTKTTEEINNQPKMKATWV